MAVANSTGIIAPKLFGKDVPEQEELTQVEGRDS